MGSKYEQWINDYVRLKAGDVKNACAPATLDMCAAFPELTRVRGCAFPGDYQGDIDEAMPHPLMELDDRRLAFDSMFGLEQHWWCVTPSGQILDPTRIQYSWETIQYVPYEEEKHGPAPYGKCLDCGEFFFVPKAEFCDSICQRRFMDDLNKSEIRIVT